MGKLKRLSNSIEKFIIEIRGRRVMLDADLALLYGVSTKRLNEQVRRNIERFPADFMIKLTQGEKTELVANCDRFTNLKHSSSLPCAFTEHGALMLASVLNSSTAINISVEIIRAFAKMKSIIITNAQFAKQVKELEKKVSKHDENFKFIFDLLHKLIEASSPNKRKSVGFHT